MLAKSWPFNRLFTIFGKKYGSFSQKLWAGKKLSKSVQLYFKTQKMLKKVPTAIKLGGGGGKVAWPL